jgi:integrase
MIKAKMQDGKVGARNWLALIKRFFRWAIAQRAYGVTSSPCVALQASAILGEMTVRVIVSLSDDEIFAFWRATKRMPYPYGPAHQTLMLTALRLNEVMDASTPEFDVRKKLWIGDAAHVVNPSTKQRTS